MGVVRQAVKRSAGRSGDMGNSWSEPQAASCMQFLNAYVYLYMHNARIVFNRGFVIFRFLKNSENLFHRTVYIGKRGSTNI